MFDRLHLRKCGILYSKVSKYTKLYQQYERITMHEARSDAEATDTTLAVIRQYFDTCNQHDIDAIMSLITEDCVFENTLPPPDGARCEGASAIRAFWEAFLREVFGANVVDKCLSGFEKLPNRFVAICCRLLRAESRLKPLAGNTGASRSPFAQCEPALVSRPSCVAIIGVSDSQNLPRWRIVEYTCETCFGANYQPRLAQRPTERFLGAGPDCAANFWGLTGVIKGHCDAKRDRIQVTMSVVT
jgi:hypothetical protein